MSKKVTIKFESENFRFFLNFYIKDECNSQEKMLEAVNELNNFFDFAVTEIYKIQDDGKPYHYYKLNDLSKLPPDDENNMLSYKYNINNDYCDNLIVIQTSSKIHGKEKELLKILSKYFLSGNRHEEIIKIRYYGGLAGGAYFYKNFKKNKKVGIQFALPHQNSCDSNIEKMLCEALIKAKINFITQQKIYYQNRLLTIIDIYIESHNLAIYCDGFQYHYNKDSVIKDRTQDRILQLLGYKVLRYTGSEIFNNIIGCLNEIDLFLKKEK